MDKIEKTVYRAIDWYSYNEIAVHFGKELPKIGNTITIDQSDELYAQVVEVRVDDIDVIGPLIVGGKAEGVILRIKHKTPPPKCEADGK